MKWYKPEQIVTLLRQIEEAVASLRHASLTVALRASSKPMEFRRQVIDDPTLVVDFCAGGVSHRVVQVMIAGRSTPHTGIRTPQG